MGAKDLFSKLFGVPKSPKKTTSKLKEVPKNPAPPQAKPSSGHNINTTKAEIELLKKKISEKIERDPEMQKKAAMVLEKILNEGRVKK